MTIRDPEAVNALISDVWLRYGALDILINNAGGQFPQWAIDYSIKGWHAVIDTNLNGTWYMMQAAARSWRDAGRPGSIVNVTASVTNGSPGTAHTAAARAAVWNLTKSLATEWADLRIRVNGIAPGLMRTEGLNQYSADIKHIDSNPVHRYSHPAEVANAICFLACRDADFITGETLIMDGGAQNFAIPWAISRPVPTGER
jgi:citronellol/citronellal dehydrogenase